VIVPGLAVQVTEGLKLPVPDTVEAHWLVWPVCRLAGLQVVVTPVIVGAGGFTVIVADPDFVESCTDVAVIVACVAVITVGAVKTPEAVIVPALADQVTVELKLPVPCIVGVHWLVCPDWMVEGRQESITEVMLGIGFTMMVVDPDFVGSAVDVAVIVACVAAVTAGAV
jgi:hypothetical protein